MASSISSVPFPIALKNDDGDERNDKESESPEFLNNKNSNKYDLNSKIMVTAIISLSVVVLLVLALHVYARHALRRHARRRREAALHRLTLYAAESQAQAQAQAHAHAQAAKPSGLDASAIASLPAVSTSGGSSDCPVCLGALAEGEAARLLPGCGHAFHVECIDAWLASQASCPVCRAVVVPPPPRPEPREGPSAPPLGSLSINALEVGTTSSEHAYCGGGKALSSSSRFSSFRRMITRERSSSLRVQSSSDQDQELVGNLERGSD